MTAQKIIVYGTVWCGDCYRVRYFLKAHSVEYVWINIDRDKDSEQFVIDKNNGMRSVPTILFIDGSVLVEPTIETLAKKLGIKAHHT